MKVVVGTRGSKLALAQTGQVVDLLKEKHPEVAFEIKVIKTKGDLIQNVPLDKIGDKGIFTKEIEEALLKGEIDLAVHSMKDMPSSLPEGLCFSYTPKREDPRDVLVLREGYKSLEGLPEGATIGTGSKRRKYQLLSLRPDLNVVPIRGNVDTRIRKITEEDLAGIVLAASGLHRVGLKEKISVYLEPEAMLPAPAQGILALEIRKGDAQIHGLIAAIEDPVTAIEAKAERALLDALDGSCHIPMGAYCEVKGNNLKLKGLYGDAEGEKIVVGEMEGVVGEEEELGKTLALRLRKEYSKDGR